jgi:hypothetical protein
MNEPRVRLKKILNKQLNDETWPERFIDSDRTAMVIRGFTLGDRVYKGTKDLEEVSHREYFCSTDTTTTKRGMVQSQMTREQLGRPLETITSASSVVKKLRAQRFVMLVPPTSGHYDDVGSPWDAFALRHGCGFRPWNMQADHEHIPKLPETDYDSCWVPCRRHYRNWQTGGHWSELFFLEWRIAQRVPLYSESDGSPLVIDLEGYEQLEHEKMVTGAY